MKKLTLIALMALSLYAENNQTQESTLEADVSAQEAASDWTFMGNIVYSSRPYEGAFTKNSTTTTGGNVVADTGMLATDDTMGLGNSNTAMFLIGAKYKRWVATFNYMPTNYEGQGTALIGTVKDDKPIGTLTTAPLATNINVKMYLTNVSYNLIETENTTFGIGIGFGATSVDMSLIPDVPGDASDISIKSTQPFGFLSMHMNNKYDKFLYGFSVRGISAEFKGVDVSYSDYKIDLGYRWLEEDAYTLDLVGGYRTVNFDAEITLEDSVAASTMTLKGPFIGVTFTY